MIEEHVSMDSAVVMECTLATDSTAEVSNESFTKIAGQTKGIEWEIPKKPFNPSAIWRPSQRAIKGSQIYPNARN